MLTVFPGDFRVIHLYAQRLQASATGLELLQQAPGGERVAPGPFAPAPLLTVTSENTHQEFPTILGIKSKLFRQPCQVFHDITRTFISVVYSFTPVLHPALYPNDKSHASLCIFLLLNPFNPPDVLFSVTSVTSSNITRLSRLMSIQPLLESLS